MNAPELREALDVCLLTDAEMEAGPVAWAALQLPARTGLAVMAGVFVLQYAMDRRLAHRHAVPPWFLPLRFRLTAVVVACLSVAAAA